jgi:Plasmid encoded RepA protein
MESTNAPVSHRSTESCIRHTAQPWTLLGSVHTGGVDFTGRPRGLSWETTEWTPIMNQADSRRYPADFTGDSTSILEQLFLPIAYPSKVHGDRTIAIGQVAGMGKVHDLLELKGKQGALLADFDRMIVEAAAQYLGDDENSIGFLYSGWCQAALPHRKLPNESGWQIESERMALVVEPGMRPTSSGKPEPVGVPYGSRARLIMIYLQSEAIRTQSREILLGRSLREWLAKMGIPVGGKSLKDVRDQCERISRCRLSLTVRHGSRVGMTNQNVVDTAMFVDTDQPGQGSLFVETARLSEGFYNQLRRHPVPLQDAAIRAIANNSMALDVYAWLAYRLHSLDRPRPISWTAVKAQFGAGYARMDHFKINFRPTLALALAVYPDARVDEDDRGAGLVLHPSKPPVPNRLVAISTRQSQ